MAGSGSSNTSSRTSTSSSTSDRALARAGALFRLVHPFPSILDGLVVAGAALLAGGGAATASRLGVSMTALQFAIGALNDLVDRTADQGHVPAKPIPAGLVTPRGARIVAVAAATVGVVTAAIDGPAMAGLALVVLAIGAAYDLLAKGTPWSWVPFAIGIPILPVYGWYGARTALAPAFAILLPMAVLAGAGLAIANARADLDTDRRSGTRSIATALGARRSWIADVVLTSAAIAIGIVFIGRVAWTTLPYIGVLIGIAIVGAAIGLGSSSDRRYRRAAWHLQAIGVAVAGIAWVAGVLVPG